MAKMTMITQFLVAAVAVGMTLAQEPPPPEYVQNLKAIRHASKALATNVLSMEGNIPLLNDSRRHYAEIVHVINYHAVRRSGGVVFPYYEEYYPYLNVSAPEAISNPEVDLANIRDFQDAVYDKSNKLIELIDSCVLEPKVCNALVDDTVKEMEDEYQHPATVLFAAGKAASVYNALNKQFEEVSNNLMAHHFVTTSPEDLEDVVNAVGDVYRKLYLVT